MFVGRLFHWFITQLEEKPNLISVLEGARISFIGSADSLEVLPFCSVARVSRKKMKRE